MAETARGLVGQLLDALRPGLLRGSSQDRAQVKGDGSLVTVADRATDEQILRTIQRRFPTHEVISEERETVYGGAEWCWVVDPLDGTTNFVRGLPAWCVSIALTHQGWPVLGVIDLPAWGRRLEAITGRGAYMNGQPISVTDADWSDQVRLQHALVAVSSGIGRHYVMDLPLRPRALGSAGVNISLVAQGLAVASVHPSPSLWDIAAGVLLVEEAGGVILSVDAEPPFPLQVGVDYAARRLRFVAAAGEETARRTLQATRPR